MPKERRERSLSLDSHSDASAELQTARRRGSCSTSSLLSSTTVSEDAVSDLEGERSLEGPMPIAAPSENSVKSKLVCPSLQGPNKWLVHPLVRPTDADPERQRSWRKLERQRDLGDLLSTLQSSIGEDRTEESTLTIDEGVRYEEDHQEGFGVKATEEEPDSREGGKWSSDSGQSVHPALCERRLHNNPETIVIATDNVGSPRAWEKVASEDEAYKVTHVLLSSPPPLRTPLHTPALTSYGPHSYRESQWFSRLLPPSSRLPKRAGDLRERQITTFPVGVRGVRTPTPLRPSDTCATTSYYVDWPHEAAYAAEWSVCCVSPSRS
ncbi:hypothetical protein Sango_1944000 [Sesamum angolense]|uniref:Uncharacterized protein n=1 Tax=Sesamum angolense TaxID=2727404 RepID=A0AAE1WE89_9LAMI|nr:hypothetical protein Sango_1944000 [Sesamum angolense]